MDLWITPLPKTISTKPIDRHVKCNLEDFWYYYFVLFNNTNGRYLTDAELEMLSILMASEEYYISDISNTFLMEKMDIDRPRASRLKKSLYDKGFLDSEDREEQKHKNYRITPLLEKLREQINGSYSNNELNNVSLSINLNLKRYEGEDKTTDKGIQGKGNG